MVSSPGQKPPTVPGVPEGEDPAVLEQAPLLARLSLTRPIFVTSVVLLTLFVGLLSYFKLGVDLFPEIEIPVVSVQVPYRGAGPAEIETLVVKPIEDELSTLAGVKRILSSCDDGSGTVTCQFYDGTDMKDAEQQVRNRVENIRNKLPKEIDAPIILRVNLSDQPIMQVGLEADLPPAQLYDLADQRIKNRFSQVPGVGKVDLLGGRKREVEVLLDRDALQRRSLSATQVTNRIGDSSQNVPVGKVAVGSTDLNFRTIGEYRSLSQIADAVVSFTDRPVRVHEVGTVVESLEDAKSLAYVNGRPAIVFNIYKQTGANTVKVADGVEVQIANLNAGLKGQPGAPVLKPLQDGSVWIRQNVEDVQETIAIGILLVLIVVYFFLGNFRSTVITSLALPNSLIGAFLLMHLAGFTINIMTLLALSLSVGLLIDDAIVVRENIFRHIEHGESAWKAALLGTKEVNMAVIATSSVVIAVFLPVGFLGGTVGKFLSQFGLTMCFAMLISLFDAITIAPMLSAYFAGKGEQSMAKPGSFNLGGALLGLTAVGLVGLVAAHGDVARCTLALLGAVGGGLAPGFVGAFEHFQDGLEHTYGRLIRWVVEHRGWTVLAAFGIFILSFVAAAHVTNTFIPQSDNPEFAVGLEMPVGTSLQRTGQVALQVDQDVRTHHEVRVTSLTVKGTQGNLYVGMVPPEQRSLSSEDLKTLLRKELDKKFPGDKISVGDFDPTAAGQKPFTLILKGNDLTVLSAYASTLKAAISKAVPGLPDLDTNYRPGKPEFQIRLDPLQAGRLGVGTVSAGQELRNLVDGTVAGKYRVGGWEYDIRVRLQEDQRNLEKAFKQTWVPNVNGNLVRLSSVATGVLTSGPSSITRRDRERSIVIDADLGQGAGLG
ncbi:MAG: efflux RND transporter permease subunit, partial [bacterium]